MENKFVSQRNWHDDEQTFGFISGCGYKAHVLEDEPREKKVRGETRIAAGTYLLGIRAEDTPLTLKHRVSYNEPDDEWFEYHIELLNVPNFTDIYIHSGIDQTHTDGCQLYADCCDLTKDKNPMSYSKQAIKRFYKMFYQRIKAGEKFYIEIRDENN